MIALEAAYCSSVMDCPEEKKYKEQKNLSVSMIEVIFF